MTKQEVEAKLLNAQKDWKWADAFDVQEADDKIVTMSASGDWETDDAERMRVVLGATSYMIHGGGCETCGYGAECEFILPQATE